jgi:hypothetical protein
MITATAIAIGINIASMHSKPGYNDRNPGVYVVAESGYAAGLYHNSHRKLSVWAGRQFSTDSVQLGPVKASAAVLAGGITGYGKPSILVSPSVAAEYSGVTYRLSYAPKHPSKQDASDAIHLSVSFKIGKK